MAADAPPTHEYFSGNGQQGLYAQQQDFSRLGFNPQQQQQQRQWAAAQQQMRANQYAAAMKQKQMAALQGMRQPQGQYPQQQFNNYPSPAFNQQQAFNFPGTPQQQINPGTPRDQGFPTNPQRDFSTPQREFSAGPQRDFTGTPVNGPSREFSATPAPAPSRDFSGTPQNQMNAQMPQMGTPAPGQRDLPTGTPAPQPHAFLPNRSMAGTPSMGQMNMPHPGSRTGTPIVRPGTAMSGGGSFSEPGQPQQGMRASQPPPTPKMGMGPGMGGLPNGMSIPNIPNMGMNMGMQANMGMPGNMNAMNMQNNINMGGMGQNAMGLSGPNPMGGMPGANNNMGMPGASNMGMQPNNSMGLSNAGMPGANMPGSNNMGMPSNNPMMPTNNPMGIQANNTMGMPGAGMPGPNNLGMSMPNMMPGPNGLNMSGNNLAMSGNNLGMPGAGGMNMPGPGGMNIPGAGGNNMGMPAGNMNMPAGGMNLGGSSANNMSLPGANPMSIPPTNIPIPGGAPNLAGGNISPTKPMGLGINVASTSNALGMGGMMQLNGVGMIGLNGTPARPTPPSTVPGASTSPTKIGRRVVSGPMPPSPTKPPAAPALPNPPGTNPQTTLVTPLPLLKDETDITHGGALPPVTESEMKDIQGWMARDGAFQKVYAHVSEHRAGEEASLRNVKHTWWEMEEHSGMAKFQIWWPAEQRKMKDRKMKLLGRRDLDVSKIARSGALVTGLELLVPIRLEIDHDHYRLRDTFTWNLNDPVITPEIFAQCLCDDYQIQSNSVVQAVAKSITEQLQEHRAHIVEPVSGPKSEIVRGEISEKGEEWWARWRRREEGVEMEVDDEVDTEMNEELRVYVKVDVLVGTMNLTDQFEWDINDPNNSPEEFAETYCRELGLGGEFKTAVAHAIREQVSVYQKSLFLVGHPFDGTPIADDELRTAMLPPIDHSFRFDRTLLEQFTPQLNVLQESEIERNEREREKELKRKRRQTRGRRGVALPDRDLQKTYRTAIGFAEIEPTPAQQAAQQPPPVTYRRAAAAAASLTIANLAATENGTSPVQTPMHIPEKPPVLVQQQQQPPPPQPPKQKQRRTGILQPPPLPKHVFVSRPSETGPSTGLDSDEAAAARTEFGDAAPEGPASPAGEEDGQQAMLKRVLEKGDAESTEGLHPNMIDGTWHCSNCGCPESISVGRRKGPMGQGTMCGECGKFWHKHRKPRPVEYTTSLEHHLNLKKLAKAKKRGVKVNVNINPSPSKPPSGTPAANGRDSLSPSPPPKPTPLDPGSPDSTIGPDSPKAEPPALSLPPPVEERKPTPTPTPAPKSAPATSEEPQSAVPPSETNGKRETPPAASPQSQVSVQTKDGIQMPAWILECLAATQRRYVNDRIDVIAKPRANESEAPAFRLKCLDCPGKLYTPGPDQTLSNFEVHLKNRAHRANVNKRVAAEAAANGQPVPDLRRVTPQTTPAPASAPAPTPTPTPTPAPAPEPNQSN